MSAGPCGHTSSRQPGPRDLRRSTTSSAHGSFFSAHGGGSGLDRGLSVQRSPCRSSAWSCGLTRGSTLDENRVLASLPAVNLKRATLAKFPAKFETLLQRSVWLPPAADPVAQLRQGGWPGRIALAQGRPWARRLALLWRCRAALLPCAANRSQRQELEKWQHVFENRRDWLAARGIPYLIVFAPNKSTIYPEHMPSAYNPVHTQSRLDQLMAHLKCAYESQRHRSTCAPLGREGP